MDTLKDKAIKAAVEGKLLKKTINKVEKVFDKKIGNITRSYIFRNELIENNKILMLTQQGDFTCNEKFITLELLKENVNCKIVWALRQEQLKKAYEIPQDPRIKLVTRFTYEFYRELASCKILLINSVDPYKNPLKKKRGQYVIQTWHGSLGIKRFDKAVFNGREWVKAAILCGKETDFCVSNSAFEDEVYRNTYWEHTPILRYGHARNDILFLEGIKKKCITDRLVKHLHLDPSYHYALYAPTFRDNHRFDCYRINYDDLIEALSSKFGGKWRVLVRYHLNVRRFSKNSLEASDNVIDVTDYPDIQEIMLLADIAITDYSSWIYDFILTYKPGFIFATDIAEYNNERGFYYKLEATPFSIAQNNQELIENILRFDSAAYKNKVKLFLDDKGCMDDGQACYRLVQKIKEIMGNK